MSASRTPDLDLLDRLILVSPNEPFAGVLPSTPDLEGRAVLAAQLSKAWAALPAVDAPSAIDSEAIWARVAPAVLPAGRRAVWPSARLAWGHRAGRLAAGIAAAVALGALAFGAMLSGSQSTSAGFQEGVESIALMADAMTADETFSGEQIDILNAQLETLTAATDDSSLAALAPEELADVAELLADIEAAIEAEEAWAVADSDAEMVTELRQKVRVLSRRVAGAMHSDQRAFVVLDLPEAVSDKAPAAGTFEGVSVPDNAPSDPVVDPPAPGGGLDEPAPGVGPDEPAPPLSHVAAPGPANSTVTTGPPSNVPQDLNPPAADAGAAASTNDRPALAGGPDLASGDNGEPPTPADGEPPGLDDDLRQGHGDDEEHVGEIVGSSGPGAGNDKEPPGETGAGQSQGADPQPPGPIDRHGSGPEGDYAPPAPTGYPAHGQRVDPDSSDPAGHPGRGHGLDPEPPGQTDDASHDRGGDPEPPVLTDSPSQGDGNDAEPCGQGRTHGQGYENDEELNDETDASNSDDGDGKEPPDCTDTSSQGDGSDEEPCGQWYAHGQGHESDEEVNDESDASNSDDGDGKQPPGCTDTSSQSHGGGQESPGQTYYPSRGHGNGGEPVGLGVQQEEESDDDDHDD